MRNRRGLMLLIFGLFLLSLSSFASAKITISNVNNVYNLGDKLYLTVKLSPSSLSGFFEINLVCENSSINIYRVPAEAAFTIGEEQTVSTNLILAKDYIGDLRGKCNILSSIGNEESSTNNFAISESIVIKTNFDKANYNPEETITLEVEATKENGGLLNGFVEGSGATDFNKEIKGGKMTHTFAMPRETEKGEYKINLFVYDKDKSNTILNKINSSAIFRINQVASSVELSLSNLEVMPGENLSLSPQIYDQSRKAMNGIVSLNIVSPAGKEEQISVKSGEYRTINLALNATAGVWKIYLSFNSIFKEKEFTVKELQKVDFEFLDSILIVRNVGNTVYNKTIDVQIGEKVEQKQINLGIGEEIRFNLKAPNGEYEVSAGDEEGSVKKTLSLTGGSISVDSLVKAGFFSRYSFVWIFLVIIVMALGIVLFFKFRKREFKLKDRIKAIDLIRGKSSDEPKTSGKKRMIDLSKPRSAEAKSTLVLKGEKNKSTVISLKIKNYRRLNEHAQRKLEELLEIAKNKKGVVDSHKEEEHVLIIFSPQTTKTFNNEMLAVKTAFEIHGKLREYNRMSQEKIDFNIGINSGEMISSLEGGALNYTSVGNTILLAKRISDFVEGGYGKLLISNEIRRKLGRDLRVKREGTIGKSDIYSIETIANKEANEEKLKDLLRRMKKD